MKPILNNYYIHSNNQPLSGLNVNLVEDIINTKDNSGFQNYIKQCIMHSREIPGCSNYLFGFDKIELSTPIFDPSNGEQLVDIDSIMQKSIRKYSNKCEKLVKQNKDHTGTQANVEDPGQTKKFVTEYEIFNGYLADFPVKIGHKLNELYVQLTPSRITKGHNASPMVPEKLYDSCEIVSKELGLDLWFFKVTSVEFSLGISTNKPIKSIVDSLGDSRVSKNTKRFPMINGVKWLHMYKGSSLQVYSTNLKNLNDSKINYGTRCHEFENPSNKGLDSIRVEMHRYFNNDNLLLQDIINPKLIVEQLELFRKNIKSINKNISHIHSERLKDLDLNLALSSISNTKDLLTFASSIGIVLIYDNMMSSLAHMKGLRRPRIVGALEKGLHYFEDSISKFIIKEHFHDIIINVIDYYIEYYTLEKNI